MDYEALNNDYFSNCDELYSSAEASTWNPYTEKEPSDSAKDAAKKSKDKKRK